MTYICYRGIEVSARFQRVLLGVELVMLLVFSVTALVRVGTGHHPAGSLTPALVLVQPVAGRLHRRSSAASSSCCSSTGAGTPRWRSTRRPRTRHKTPGRAAILSTVILLVTYVLVILAAQSFAGVGTTGIGLGNTDNSGDVLSVLGSAVFGSYGHRAVPRPAADPHGAQLGRGVDPDDDPAHGAHHAVDGDLQGAAEGVRQDAPALPDAHRVHASPWASISRAALPRVQLHLAAASSSPTR